MKFETLTGAELMQMPYKNQHVTPTIYIINISREMSLVDLVFTTCQTCGINAIVVKIPANVPNKVVKSKL